MEFDFTDILLFQNRSIEKELATERARGNTMGKNVSSEVFVSSFMFVFAF